MLVRLNVEITGTEPPAEFRIFGFGTVKTVKGDFTFDQEAAQLVLAAAARWGNRYSIDYEHQAIMGGAPAPAAAWFDLALRDDGLWAVNVEWTGRAAEFLRNREYRYFSPAFDFDAESRRITELVNVALTNLPATKDMMPLVASRQGNPAGQQEGAKQLKGILAALGLADTATEGEAVAALTRIRDVNKDLLALTGKATASEALGVAQAWKAAHDQVAALSTRVAELEAEKAAREVDEVVAKAKADRKLSAAQEQWARDLGKKDLASLKAFVEAAVLLSVGGPEHQEPGGGGSGVAALSAVERDVARQLGIPEDKFAARKAALSA